MKSSKVMILMIGLSWMTTSVADPMQNKLAALEKSLHGKIGVYALNTNNNEVIAYRENQRFHIESTMKVMSVAALLKKSETDTGLLTEKIGLTKNDLDFWSPVTKNYVNQSMSFAALAEAAITYSDTPAINLITKRLGGKKNITEFAHSIGNQSYNLEHLDGKLTTDPNDARDTSTPRDMAMSLQKIILGDVLSQAHRTTLMNWMRNNTTGNKRIRAGMPQAWVVADKTGTGDHGIANDFGIVWSPSCKPIVLAIYTTQFNKKAKQRDDIIASVTSTIMDEFAKNDRCFD